MTAATSVGRVALSSFTDSDLNITRNSSSRSSKLVKTDSFLQSTPIKSRSLKRPLAALELTDSNRIKTTHHKLIENDPYDISDNISPRIKRARLIKMKLQIAWYKVKTNQTTTPVNELKFPMLKKKIQTRPTSPVTKKSMLEMAASKVYQLPSLNISPTYENFSLHGNKMDDIVSKRVSQTYYKGSNTFNVPASAPASTLSFLNANLFNSTPKPTSVNSSSSPTKFSLALKASSATTEMFKLPPISKILHKEQEDQTIDQTFDSTIIEAEQKSLINGLSFRENNDILNGNDRDVIVEQVTPVRVTEDVMKRSKLDKTVGDEEITKTQIWSSPTALQTTPSSIGAARCLLQLAHR